MESGKVRSCAPVPDARTRETIKSSFLSEGYLMNRPFNMPDEFVDGFVKAGASLWRSLGWTANGERDGTALDEPFSSSGRIAELQADYMKGLYKLAEHV